MAGSQNYPSTSWDTRCQLHKGVLTSLITKIKKVGIINWNWSLFFLFLIYKFSTWPGKMTMLSFLTTSMLRRYLDTWMPSHSQWILAWWWKRLLRPSTDPLTNFSYITLFFEESSQLSTNLFDLQEDFRLIISNAKTFNPPGMIYHTKMDRIEVWARAVQDYNLYWICIDYFEKICLRWCASHTSMHGIGPNRQNRTRIGPGGMANTLTHLDRRSPDQIGAFRRFSCAL